MASHKSKKENASFGEIQQEIVQAVIVADSFNVRFAPLSSKKPRVLLPLVNRPMLDYSLEYLKSSGVQEVFVLCCSHAPQIREFLKNSPWCNENSNMIVTPIMSEGYLSLGDALRELDAKSLIRSDFILLGGDIISNLPLLDILQEHKKQVQRDKGCIMTMVFRKATPKHRTRAPEDEAVICIESSTQRVLHYQKVANQSKIELPTTLFQEHKEISLRYDLLDTHISICSKHVPTLFVDNFDFQTRDNFVKGILINEEILGNSIYASIAENGYAARVLNFRIYDSISQDIIQRWSYPVVPDSGVRYNYHRHNIYLHKEDVDLARECVLDKNVVIGQGTKIGNRTFISNSVIGQNCVIGDDVRIEGCYLWDNVTIEDNCNLTCCLLADGVNLKSKCVIGRGTVLSYDVIIGPNVKLEERSLWQATPQIKGDDFEEEKPVQAKLVEVCDAKVVGSLGKAFPFVYNAQEESSEDEGILEASYAWGFDLTEQYADENSASEEDSMDDENSEDGGSPPPDDTRLFYNEVLDSLLRGVEENVKSDNLILEVNSSKYAYNITMKEVNTLVTKAILKIPSHQNNNITSIEYWKAMEPLLKNMLPLIKNYIRSLESQSDCLIALEEFSLENEVFSPILIKVLKFLYDRDVFDEEVMVKWYNNPRYLPDIDISQQKSLRNKVKKFIDWLQEAEEESD